jgi:hypothetical protein
MTVYDVLTFYILCCRLEVENKLVPNMEVAEYSFVHGGHESFSLSNITLTFSSQF